MRLLWTYRNTTGSRLIRWALNEPVSHFAIEHRGIVFNQVLGGFKIDYFQEWVKEYKVYASLTPYNEKYADTIIAHIVRDYRKSSYDVTGWIYFAYRALLLKFFGKTLPPYNLLDTTHNTLCVGISSVLYKLKPEWFGYMPEDFDMITPW